ncbi:MAG TPA: IucA/IucC family protein, partial [Anaerolineales bacterium]
MLIEKIVKYSEAALVYQERYINDGSPSGFTETNRTSTRTDQFGLTPWFYLYCVEGQGVYFSNYGIIPLDMPTRENGRNWLFIHPDMVSNFPYQKDIDIYETDFIKVVPTSSGRTVQLFQNHSRDYIKLHYDAIVGRINRGLPYVKAIAGPEITNHIRAAIEDEQLPAELSIMEEVGARIIKYNNYEAGMVWRKGIPFGRRTSNVKYLLPYFSLFSIDRLHSYEPILLQQIIDYRDIKPEQFLTEIILPIIDIYFNLLLKLGFQDELNAQNILLGMDENFVVKTIVLRDMMGVEKDLTLREVLHLDNSFDSYPYKCINNNLQDELYVIRHSFAFDFKL